MRNCKVINCKWFDCLVDIVGWLNTINKWKVGKSGWPTLLIPFTANNATQLSVAKLRQKIWITNEKWTCREQQKAKGDRGKMMERRKQKQNLGWSFLLWIGRKGRSIIFPCSTDLTYRSQFLFPFPNQNLQLQKSCVDWKNHDTGRCKALVIKMKL